MASLSDICREVKSYNPHEDTSFIQNAYHFAEKVQEGEKSLSGGHYVIDRLEVAQILGVMKLDVPSIAAGLLHDTVEDTSTSLEEVKRSFGVEVAGLVDGVTKLGKIKFANAEEKQAENFR